MAPEPTLGPAAPAAPGIALVCDLDGTARRIIRDDLALGDRLGPGQPLAALADAEAAPKTRFFLDALREHHAAFDWEINVALPDGTVRPLHFAGALIDDGCLVTAALSRVDLQELHAELMRMNNEAVNALRERNKALALAERRWPRGDEAVIEDLTRVNNELANLQRELAHANAALERADAARRQVLRMVAHDLRTPLGVIQSFSGLLRFDAAARLDARQRGHLEMIDAAAASGLQLISDLVDLSALEAGQLAIERRPQVVERIVAHAVQAAGAIAAAKSIRIALRREPAAAGAVAELDAGRIGQVLQNLLGNAVKFSPPGRDVEVVLAAPDAAPLRLEVRDHGLGIAAEDLPLLFKPFGRTRTQSTAGETSTGLGLAIVRSLVEAHGGTVGVESTPGVGSTFWFTLPRAT